MSRVSRVVRFYEPTKVDQNDKPVTISETFWTVLFDALEKDAAKDRRFAYSGYDYYGESRTSSKPARRYLYVGRLRDKDDWPDTFTPTSGTVGDLTVSGLLLEPTFLVPFGAKNYCAVMTPKFSAMGPSALESWLTAACGLTTSNDRIELRPILDKKVAKKLKEQATGVTKLSVRLPAGVDLSGQDGGGDVGKAVRAASESATGQMSAVIEYSLGHSRDDGDGQAMLLAGAKWIVDKVKASRAEVSMLIPTTRADGEATVRSETHDLFKDRIAYQSAFTVPDGQKPSESSVMGAIQNAIDRFNLEN